jgi:hypothetical protein
MADYIVLGPVLLAVGFVLAEPVEAIPAILGFAGNAYVWWHVLNVLVV